MSERNWSSITPRDKGFGQCPWLRLAGTVYNACSVDTVDPEAVDGDPLVIFERVSGGDLRGRRCGDAPQSVNEGSTISVQISLGAPESESLVCYVRCAQRGCIARIDHPSVVVSDSVEMWDG